MRLSLALLILAAPATLAQGRPGPREVSISARDGRPIAATYFSPGHAGPAAVVFRNCDVRRATLDSFAIALRDRGVHVVTYDYRDGTIAGKDWAQTRIEDAGAVHDWLVANAGVDSTRLAAIGGSCGSALALQFAATYPSRVRAALLMSIGPTSDAQRATAARLGDVALLGVGSRGESSDVNMEPLVAASRNAHSRFIALDGRSHGTNMLIEPTGVAAIALDWIAERLRAPRHD